MGKKTHNRHHLTTNFSIPKVSTPSPAGARPTEKCANATPIVSICEWSRRLGSHKGLVMAQWSRTWESHKGLVTAQWSRTWGSHKGLVMAQLSLKRSHNGLLADYQQPRLRRPLFAVHRFSPCCGNSVCQPCGRPYRHNMARFRPCLSNQSFHIAAQSSSSHSLYFV